MEHIHKILVCFLLDHYFGCIIPSVSCAVCGDRSSGKHYGAFVCDGCSLFFKRSVQSDRRYTCSARLPGECIVDKEHRNQCRACRFKKCFQSGMNKNAIQDRRGPKNSTIRRQMELFMQASPPRPVFGAAVPLPVHPTLPKQKQIPPLMPIYNRQPMLCDLPGLPQPPPPLRDPIPFNPASICTEAARIIFKNVRCTTDVSTLVNLSREDRIILIEESWKKLFILGAAQFLYPMDLDNKNTKGA